MCTQIALGTVNNIAEAVEWLSYSFLFVRMRLNPLAYGIPYTFKEVGEQTSKISVYRSRPGDYHRLKSKVSDP